MADLFSPMQVDPSLFSKTTAPKPPSDVPFGAASQASIAKSAHDFEAMAIAQFLQPMFNTVDPSKGLFGGGEGEAAWRPMMVEQLAKQLANHGGLGLAKQIQAAMERAQENKRK
jgi:flagellar protein FlgJ